MPATECDYGDFRAVTRHEPTTIKGLKRLILAQDNHARNLDPGHPPLLTALKGYYGVGGNFTYYDKTPVEGFENAEVVLD